MKEFYVGTRVYYIGKKRYISIILAKELKR